MGLRLSELFDLDSYADMKNQGYLRVQTHPRFPELHVSTYTHKAQYGRVWNDVTRTCRGLIHNSKTLDVVARPFRKFFNHGEPEAPQFHPDEPVYAYDKLDGWLGVLYSLPLEGPQYAIATRGSFQSEGAIIGTEILNSKYKDWKGPLDGFTYLFEIIHPQTRIVLDYEGQEDLVFLGMVSDHGVEYGPFDDTWPGPKAERLPHRTFREVLEAAPRENREGMVVASTTSSRKVKVKQADYCALHKVVTNLTERTIYDAISDGLDLLEIVAGLPPEHAQWATEVYLDLHARLDEITFELHTEYMDILDRLGTLSPERKVFAAAAVDSQNPGIMFALYDNRPIQPEVWKSLRPVGNARPFQSEKDA